MKKALSVFLFVFFLLPLFALADERYCFTDQFGYFYDFKGGKVGKKAFLIQVNNGNCPASQITGLGTFVKANQGYEIFAFISRDPAGLCSSYQLSLFAESDLLVASGTFDPLPRNFPPYQSITLTRASCSGALSPTPTVTSSTGFGPGSKEEE